MVCSTRSLIGYCYWILARMIRLHRGPVQWYYATMVVAMPVIWGWGRWVGFLSFFFFGRRAQMQTRRRKKKKAAGGTGREEGCREEA